jgi:cytochrome c553
MSRALLIVAMFALAGQACAGDAAKGKQIAEKGAGGPPCAACHGLDGATPAAPENPILAGQHADYIVRALMDYKSGRRSNPVMKAVVDQMKRQDMEDAAAWFSSQKSKLHFQR